MSETRLASIPDIKEFSRLNPQTIRLAVKEQANPSSVLNILNEDWSYSFRDESGKPMVPTGVILLKPKKGVSLGDIGKISGNGLEFISKKYGCFKVLVSNYGTLLKTANKIYESGLVEYSHPDFIANIDKFQNDLLYPEQYYLNNTGQFGGTSGIDINAPQAWSISAGLQDVRVAVIDDGVENHPDLNVVPGFTINDPGGNGAPGINGAHGQACAGIIAATQNNTIGVSGVAPCAEIVPVNVFVNGATLGDIADAIDWAWDDGEADVLSASIGTNTSDAITQAIGRARNQGRGGDGSIVVFASGNSGGSVAFPGNVAGVVTVGAINRNGNIWGYSSRGPQMDLVAPSGNVTPAGQPLQGDVRTTDRQGNDGYENGDYIDGFGGTSAACPQVAGVAALMLSVNPNLTEATLVAHLQGSAIPMGPSGFDNTYGWGRLNAQEAIRRAMSFGGPSVLCSGGASYSLPGLPAGSTITWSDSGNIVRNSAQGSNPCTFSASGNGSGWIEASITHPDQCQGPTVIRKNVWAGKPTNTGINFGVWFSSPPNNQVPVYSSEAIGLFSNPNETAQGVIGYQWQFGAWSSYISGYQTVSGKTKYAANIYLDPTAASLQIVTVAAQNPCGYDLFVNPAGKMFYKQGGGYYMAVYPNPASSEIFIAQKPDLHRDTYLYS